MKILVRIGITALALLAVAHFIPGIAVANIYVALLAALVLGVLHVLVRPVLIVLTLPVTLLTFGLFVFVINAALFWCVASFVAGFHVAGFVPAFLGSLCVTLVSAVARRLFE